MKVAGLLGTFLTMLAFAACGGNDRREASSAASGPATLTAPLASDVSLFQPSQLEPATESLEITQDVVDRYQLNGFVVWDDVSQVVMRAEIGDDPSTGTELTLQQEYVVDDLTIEQVRAMVSEYIAEGHTSDPNPRIDESCPGDAGGFGDSCYLTVTSSSGEAELTLHIVDGKYFLDAEDSWSYIEADTTPDNHRSVSMPVEFVTSVESWRQFADAFGMTHTGTGIVTVGTAPSVAYAGATLTFEGSANSLESLTQSVDEVATADCPTGVEVTNYDQTTQWLCNLDGEVPGGVISAWVERVDGTGAIFTVDFAVRLP